MAGLAVPSTPHFDYACDPELLVIRWRMPTREAMHELGRLIAERYEAAGCAQVFVAIIGPDCPPPDADAREAAERVIASIYAYLRRPRVLLVGSGIRVAITRSAATILSMVTGLRGLQFEFDKTVADTVEVIASTLDRSEKAVLDALVREGLVEASELG